MTGPKTDSRAAVKAILEARKQAAIETVQDIPATPLQPVTARPGAVQPTVTAQSITQPAAVPSVQTAPAPQVSDAEVEAFLQAHLPGLIQAARNLAQPPFRFEEVVTLGGAVSAAVAAGLPQARGLEARTLVVVVTRYVWRTHGVPALPAHIRPLAGLLETLMITGIEAAYRLVVKPRK